jgi:2-methylcitrate dehydratase PrpD
VSTDGLTLRLCEDAMRLVFDDLPSKAIVIAKQCILDWFAVTIAGSRTKTVNLLADDLPCIIAGGVSLIGRADKRALYDAALINGTASHALDYDDVNYALSGHPSVPVLPAILALAERDHAIGYDFITAFIAGYEFECRVGRAVAPAHYAHGFHATATLGALGAAVACARLLKLDANTAAHAIGIAVTQAAGLKSMFGTDCKPLHAGNAARIGLQSACLAARGFTSRPDSIECTQGFAATHTTTFNPAAALEMPPEGFHLYANLFKYHASCFETHATIECCRKISDDPNFDLLDLETVEIAVNPYCDRMCNIQTPATGLEAKFSLRQTAAMTFIGISTGDPANFDDQSVKDPTICACRERIQIKLDDAISASHATLTATTKSGRIFRASHNSSEPLQDLAVQQQQLERKFKSLVEPILAQGGADKLLRGILDLERRRLVDIITSAHKN